MKGFVLQETFFPYIENIFPRKEIKQVENTIQVAVQQYFFYKDTV